MRIESGILRLSDPEKDDVPYGGLNTMPEGAVKFWLERDTGQTDYWKINFYNEEGNKVGRMYLVKD